MATKKKKNNNSTKKNSNISNKNGIPKNNELNNSAQKSNESNNSTKKNNISKNSVEKKEEVKKIDVAKDAKKDLAQKITKDKQVKKEETKEEQVIFKNDTSSSKKREQGFNGKKNNNKVEASKSLENKETAKTTAKSSTGKKVEDKKSLKESNDKNLKKPDKKDSAKVKKEIDKKKNTDKEKPKEENKVNNINTPEFFENKNKKKRKVIFIVTTIVAILVILLIFSTIFAIIHTFKATIANGVKIKNIDVSGLTYEEASSKLEEAFNTVLDENIVLKYNDYSYTIKSKNINLSYSLQNALDEAYGLGRSSNIILNNYMILGTALFRKNIDFEYTYNEDDIDNIVSEISTSVPDLVKQYSYYIDEDNLIISSGIDGIKVKTDELKQAIIMEIENRNPIEIIKDFKNATIDIPYEEVKTDSIDIDKIYSEVHSEPQDAYYTEETEDTKFAIYADVDGVDFAISIDEVKAMLEEAKNEYVIPLSCTKANITINELGIEAFPYEISRFQTTYDASNTSRSTNLEIAARKINGTVIMPGEQFSFNEVVGERTVAEGYQDAKIYSDGQVVDGLAGGICQISSTLYNAVLLANLQIDERYNHSFTTSYVKPGRDATVVYGVKDLKFTNTRTYPIKIEASVAGGVALFTINGIEEENEYDIEIIPTTTETYPYTTQTVTDYSLAPGATKVLQAGASGCKVYTTKKTYLNGSLISSEVISNDTYKVMTRIINVGPTE